MFDYITHPKYYFHKRNTIPFGPAILAVFINASCSLLLVLITYLWAREINESVFYNILSSFGLQHLAYTFIGQFAVWLAIGAVLYIVAALFGNRFTYLSTLGVAGIGFIPLIPAVVIELVLSGLYIETATITAVPNTARILLVGAGDIVYTVIVWISYIISLTLAGYIWYTGLSVGTSVRGFYSLLGVFAALIIYVAELVFMLGYFL